MAKITVVECSQIITKMNTGKTLFHKIGSFFRSFDYFQVRNNNLPTGERIISVDALRGFDMFWIMGGDVGFQALDKVFQNKLSGFIKTQFDHADWFGFHAEDIIMPLFLFLVGVSMVYSFRKRIAGGATDWSIWKHTIRRAAILWILGMLVQGNLLTYDPTRFHFYTNTLQAIAAGYLIATVIILYLPVVLQIVAAGGLMVIYWMILALIPIGDTTANAYTPDGNVAMFVEKLVMGKHIGWGTYTWIVSSINFGATVMLGVFAGYIMQSQVEKFKKLQTYVILGVILIVTGLILDIWHPIIKKIWTSSFVLFSGGICVILLAIFYYIIDILKINSGIKWMVIIGSNAIFAYVAWHLFSNNFTGMAEVFLSGLKPWTRNAHEALGIFGGTLILYIILWYMYKNRTFIKI